MSKNKTFHHTLTSYDKILIRSELASRHREPIIKISGAARITQPETQEVGVFEVLATEGKVVWAI